jgi:hypothetical protein
MVNINKYQLILFVLIYSKKQWHYIRAIFNYNNVFKY